MTRSDRSRPGGWPGRRGERWDPWGGWPLRLRLVAGFAAAMLVLLTAAGAFVYWRVEYALDRGLDTELARAARTIAPLVAGDGTVDSATADATGAVWQVVDRSGNVRDRGASAPAAPIAPARAVADAQDVRTVDVGSFLPVSDAPYRVRVTPLAGGDVLLVGVRRDHRDEALRELLVQLALAGLGALAVASRVGDSLARAALRPVERYRRRAAEVAAGTTGLRLDVPPGRDDEVTRLGHTLNEMLDALEEALGRERQFVDDASHELRTPLTLLTSRIQLARRRPRTVDEHEAVLDELAVDVARLADLAEQLLDLGGGTGDAGECDATAVVAGLVERRRLARPDHASEVEVQLPAGPVPAAIGAHVLERVVTNLLDNALRHGDAPVHLGLRRADAHAVVQVTDAGPGMPADLLAEATHRFTRSAQARSRPGAGLGLAIVEQVVTAAGGELRLCHGGMHHAVGVPSGLPCDHGPQMSVTVVVPTADEAVRRGTGRASPSS